jgi:hypothetical protein
MDISMQHGQGYAAWIWTRRKNMDMDTDMDTEINVDMGMDKTWTYFRLLLDLHGQITLQYYQKVLQ